MGVPAPQSGGDFELVAALEQRFSFRGTTPVDLAFGDRFNAPFVLSASGVQGGADETTLTGPVAVNQSGTNCGFDAVYETVSSIVTANAFTENERPVAGEFNVTADGTTHRVEFQGDVALVDGQPFDQSRIEALKNTCSFAFDEALGNDHVVDDSTLPINGQGRRYWSFLLSSGISFLRLGPLPLGRAP